MRGFANVWWRSFFGVSLAAAMAAALGTATLEAQTCCVQCSCVQLCCSDDSCQQGLGAECDPGGQWCEFACEDNGGMLLHYNCSDYCR